MYQYIVFLLNLRLFRLDETWNMLNESRPKALLQMGKVELKPKQIPEVLQGRTCLHDSTHHDSAKHRGRDLHEACAPIGH